MKSIIFSKNTKLLLFFNIIILILINSNFILSNSSNPTNTTINPINSSDTNTFSLINNPNNLNFNNPERKKIHINFNLNNISTPTNNPNNPNNFWEMNTITGFSKPGFVGKTTQYSLGTHTVRIHDYQPESNVLSFKIPKGYAMIIRYFYDPEYFDTKSKDKTFYRKINFGKTISTFDVYNTSILSRNIVLEITVFKTQIYKVLKIIPSLYKNLLNMQENTINMNVISTKIKTLNTNEKNTNSEIQKINNSILIIKDKKIKQVMKLEKILILKKLQATQHTSINKQSKIDQINKMKAKITIYNQELIKSRTEIENIRHKLQLESNSEQKYNAKIVEYSTNIHKYSKKINKFRNSFDSLSNKQSLSLNHISQMQEKSETNIISLKNLYAELERIKSRIYKEEIAHKKIIKEIATEKLSIKEFEYELTSIKEDVNKNMNIKSEYTKKIEMVFHSISILTKSKDSLKNTLNNSQLKLEENIDIIKNSENKLSMLIFKEKELDFESLEKNIEKNRSKENDTRILIQFLESNMKLKMQKIQSKEKRIENIHESLELFEHEINNFVDIYNKAYYLALAQLKIIALATKTLNYQMLITIFNSFDKNLSLNDYDEKIVKRINMYLMTLPNNLDISTRVIGDWGLGIGDWAQSPIPNPQSPIPNIIIYNII